MANIMKKPISLIARARELVKSNYSLSEIVSICEQEGLLSPRTGRPFSERSVRLWLYKNGIKGPSWHKSNRNKEKIRVIYTQSMQSMGMTPDQIERELKELL